MATFTALNLTAFSHFIPSIDYIFIYIFFLRLPRFVPPPPLFLLAIVSVCSFPLPYSFQLPCRSNSPHPTNHVHNCCSDTFPLHTGQDSPHSPVQRTLRGGSDRLTASQALSTRLQSHRCQPPSQPHPILEPCRLPPGRPGGGIHLHGIRGPAFPHASGEDGACLGWL